LETVKITSFQVYNYATTTCQSGYRSPQKQILDIFLCIICTSGTLYFLNFFFFFQGLKPDSNDKVHLGSFTYDINGSPRQTFEVIHKVNKKRKESGSA
jgi:hypothetical protein